MIPRGPNLGGLLLRDTAIPRAWRQYEENTAKLRATVFDLMCHPDATAEDIAQVRTLCLNAGKRYNEMRALMREKGFNV